MRNNQSDLSRASLAPIGVVELCVPQRAALGEGAFWDERAKALYWVDILGGKLMVYDPVRGHNDTIDFGQFVSTVVPTLDGQFILALHREIVRFDRPTRQMTVVTELEKGQEDVRYNDGKCDPSGRLWVGTMEVTGKPGRGALYCLEPDGRVSCKLPSVTISNGIAWSSDGKLMYYIDTGLNTVRVWDYEGATGQISNERTCVEYTGIGHLDGMTIDQEGMLWVAVFGEGQVRRYDPRDGSQIAVVLLPASQITSCAFGGDKLDELYVTSASVGYTKQDWTREPLAGSLFRVRGLGFQGVNLPRFGDRTRPAGPSQSGQGL